MFAVPVIHYSAALLDWSLTELNQLDIKFQKLLSMNGAHHLKGDVDCLYLPRNLGGRGFLSVFDIVECERRSLSSYLLVLFQLTVTKTKSTFSKVNMFKLTKTKTITNKLMLCYF